MVKNTTFLIIVGALITGIAAAQDMRATTHDGHEILLHDDGTWSFLEEDQPRLAIDMEVAEYTRPGDAMAMVSGERVDYQLWIDDDVWTSTTSSPNSDAEYEFQHATGDAYAVVIPERIYFPMDVLKDIALTNAQEGGMSNMEVVLEEVRNVNGNDVLCVRLEGLFFDSVPIVYYKYYYSDEAIGSIQVATITAKNLFDEFEDDFTDLLNGLVLGGSKDIE